MNDIMEIAKRDRKVMELIERSDCRIAAMGWTVGGGQDSADNEAMLTLEIGGRFYHITINLDSKVVESVEEEFFG